jgi:hypothetical protein
MSRRFQRRAWRRPRPDEMAGDTARTSSEATDTRWGVADKDFAERLIKLEHDVAVLTEVLADLLPVIGHLVNKIDDGQIRSEVEGSRLRKVRAPYADEEGRSHATGDPDR